MCCIQTLEVALASACSNLQKYTKVKKCHQSIWQWGQHHKAKERKKKLWDGGDKTRRVHLPARLTPGIYLHYKMDCVTDTDAFQTFQLLQLLFSFFFFKLGKENCLIPLASSTLLNQQMQAVRLVLSWGLCVASSLGQNKKWALSRDMEGSGGSQEPKQRVPLAGHRPSHPSPLAVIHSYKKPENETGRLGGRKRTDWRWQKLKSLFSGSANPAICMVELDLHLAQQFIKPHLLMSQTSLSEVMLPWPLPLIIYSTVQLLLLFFKMEL